MQLTKEHVKLLWFACYILLHLYRHFTSYNIQGSNDHKFRIILGSPHALTRLWNY